MLIIYLWGTIISSGIILFLSVGHLIRLRFKLKQPYPPLTGLKVSVLIPCKGNDDPGFEDNLINIIQQEYDGTVEFLFCVEDEKDSATPILRKLERQYDQVRVCVAGLSKLCAQKTYNILKGMACVTDTDVFIIADADIQPHSTWLQEMVAPFADSRVGAVTGFFRRIPVSATFRIGDYVAGILGSFISVAMTDDRVKSLWGGSLALRKAMLDEYNLYERLGTEIVDDIVIMHALRKHKIVRRFVPSCTLKSYCDMSLKSTTEWFIRQTQFSQIYLKEPYFMYYLIIIPYVVWLFLTPVIFVYGVVTSNLFAILNSSIFLFSVFLTGYLFREGVYVNPDGVSEDDHNYKLSLWTLTTPVAYIVAAGALLATRRRVKHGVLTMLWRSITYKVDIKTGKVLEVIR